MTVEQRVLTGDVASCRAPTPTRCAAHTRLYRGGTLVAEGFPVEAVSDHLAEPNTVVWLDLEDPEPVDLVVLTEELGLHPLAVEDAVHDRQRPKVDRYTDHLFLNAYLVNIDARSGALATSEVAAFVTSRALVTVRKDASIDLSPLLDRWDGSADLAGSGVGFLLHGLLDHVVDGHFAAVQVLDDAIAELEDALFDPTPHDEQTQRRSFELRKSLVQLRRVVLPMREVVNTLLRRDVGVVDERITPYFQDVYDHVLRAAEWTDSLRDLVSTLLETHLVLQGNRLNEVVRRLTAYAAILAVTTAITGFYGQNVPYPGFGSPAGFAASVVMLVSSVGLLYLFFRRRGWL